MEMMTVRSCRTVLAHHLPISHTHEAGLGSGRHLLFFLPLFPEEDAVVTEHVFHDSRSSSTARYGGSK
jgi:hypothetical protein